MSDSGEKSGQLEEFRNVIKERVKRAGQMPPEQMLFSYRGILYPTLLFTVENFEAMKNMEAREEDVLIVTYPKCGTNWSTQILQEMLTALQKNPSTTPGMLEFEMPGKYQFMNQQSSPRVIATHVNCENIPKKFFEKKTKILMILRNPKDTAVSYYHFCNKNPVLPTYPSWDKFFEDFLTGNVLYGSYFDYTLGWEKHMDDGNLLVLTFEDMKADLPTQLRKIGDFYGFSLTEEQIQLVQEKTTFASMKEKSGETHGNMGDVFFRKGEIGDWKSLFSEEQSRALDLLYEKHLAGTKLGARINYAKYCTY